MERRFLDERSDVNRGERRMNLFWSNVQTLKPAIYAKPPKPIVQRRYLDADPVGRAASTILQRSIASSIEMSDWHECTDQAVLDYLLPGRGVCWIRYEPHVRDVPADQVQQMEAAEGAGTPVEEAPEGGEGPADDGVQITTTVENEREITYEESCWDYINWRDFLHSPARVWQEVRWVARKALIGVEEGVERFGEKFREVPRVWRPEGMDERDAAFSLFERAEVYEIWDKPSRKVVWICPQYGEGPLDEVDDPLKLDGFFPCPRPLYATLTSQSLMPRADFVMYQDQADQIDDLTQRIAKVTQAIKAAGVYDAAAEGVQRVMNEGIENQLIPVINWSNFQTNGGFKGAVDFLPLEMMVQALQSMVEVREATKRDLYEITGISDIVRGQGMASATATAERIKGQFAQLRLRDRVEDVARFCRDMVRMTGEVICKHFQPQTLMMMSDYQNVTGATPELAMQAISLLKNDQSRGFRIDIEVDSTVIADQQEEQAARVEFLTMAGNFLKEAVPLAMQVPQLATLAAQMLLFGIRGFPVGREMESVFETALQQLQQAQEQPQSKPPSPEEIQAQSEQAKLQLEQQKMAMEDQWKKAEFMLEQGNQYLEQQKLEIEKERAAHDAMMSTREMSVKAGEVELASQAAEQKRRDETLQREATDVNAVQEAMKALADAMGQMHQAQQQAHGETMAGLQQTMQAALAPRRAKAIRGPSGRIEEALSVPVMDGGA